VSEPAGPGVREAIADVVRHPIRHLGRRWNWKAAILSAGSRGVLFFVVNLPAGRSAATAALATEVAYRAATSGFHAALTQAIGRAEPAWAATLAAMAVLPLVGHGGEFLVHWWRGTPRLGQSVVASVAFTMVSTAFHVFAMRRGVLVVDDRRRPFLDDLRRLPGLVLDFVLAILRGGRNAGARLACW
jgi:hypothetical protein